MNHKFTYAGKSFHFSDIDVLNCYPGDMIRSKEDLVAACILTVLEGGMPELTEDEYSQLAMSPGERLEPMFEFAATALVTGVLSGEA